MIVSNIPKIMNEKKMSYRRLTELSGISGQTIYRARGAFICECRLSTLDALAKALGVELKALFDEVQNKMVGKAAIED